MGSGQAADLLAGTHRRQGGARCSNGLVSLIVALVSPDGLVCAYRWSLTFVVLQHYVHCSNCSIMPHLISVNELNWWLFVNWSLKAKDTRLTIPLGQPMSSLMVFRWTAKVLCLNLSYLVLQRLSVSLHDPLFVQISPQWLDISELVWSFVWHCKHASQLQILSQLKQ